VESGSAKAGNIGFVPGLQRYLKQKSKMHNPRINGLVRARAHPLFAMMDREYSPLVAVCNISGDLARHPFRLFKVKQDAICEDPGDDVTRRKRAQRWRAVERRGGRSNKLVNHPPLLTRSGVDKRNLGESSSCARGREPHGRDSCDYPWHGYIRI